MPHRLQAILLLSIAVLGGLFLLASPTRAADPTPLACPSSQTVFLQGRAPANEALLVYLGGRAVGGGLASVSGAYSVPLRVQERPGSYPVEVRLRASGALVEQFVCYVDVPLGAGAPTPSPAEAVPAPPPPGGTQVATPRPAVTQVAPSPTRAATGSPTAGSATPSGSPSPSPTGPTATVTTTGTAGPSPTPTNTTTSANANEVQIDAVVIADPAFPNSEEYVQIKNFAGRNINMSGWRLVNVTRPSVTPFIFPNYTLEADTTIVVWSDTDTNDLENGDFFWNQQPPIWRVGDRAELRDAQNNLVHSFAALR